MSLVIFIFIPINSLFKLNTVIKEVAVLAIVVYYPHTHTQNKNVV